MKKKVYIDDWKVFKPYKGHNGTDLFYLKVANEVSDELIFYFGTLFKEDVDPYLYSCFITSYFEDVISKTRIFETFRNKHQEMYGKPLPFFDCSDEYLNDEINPEDIAFLTWYFINTVSEDRVIHPNIELLLIFANDIIEVFDRHYEYAPENTVLQSCYILELKDDFIDQFFEIRNLMEKLFLESYLFIPDVGQRYSEMLDEIKEVQEKEFISQIAYAATTEFLLNRKARLLHLRANELVAEFLGKNHELYDCIINTSVMLQGNFEVEEVDNKYIFLKHLASDQKVSLLKESYKNETIPKKEGINIGLIRFKNEWIHVGISYTFDISESFILDEKNDFKKSTLFNTVFKDENLIRQNLNIQQKAFYRITGDRDYILVKEAEINQFLEQFYISTNEPKKAKKFISSQTIDEENIFTLFFNQNLGIEVLENIQGAFFDEENKFLNKENSHSDFPFLLFSDVASIEIVHFCIDNFKNKIPFFNLKDRAIYLTNLDFSLRFFKPNNYKTEPNLKVV
ncbi:MAG: DUF3843 family protein [Fluviicola sp.]|jgi:hypothetical protein